MRFNRQWRDIKDFLPKVRAFSRGTDEVADLNDEVLLDFIRDSIISFVQDTKVLREYIDIELQCGVCDYPLLVPTCENIIGVGEISVGEDCYDCAGERWWTWGDIDFRIDEDSDILRINRAPLEDGRVLKTQIFVVPKRDACEVDEILYQRYHDKIIYKALYNIHMMPNMPWSSVSRADRYLRQYQEGTVEVTERRMDRGRKTRFVKGNWQIGGRMR